MAKLKMIWNVAAIYVGTIIGAGFATGKEIVEFFSKFGFIGFLGILFSGYLFIYFGQKIMQVALQNNIKSYFAFNEWLLGKKIGRAVNMGLFIMILIVTSIMLAGAAEVIFLLIPLNKSLAMILVIILSIVIMSNGIKGLSAVNVFVVPMMITFNLLLFYFVWKTNFMWETVFYIPGQINNYKAVLLPLAYVAFNLILSMPVFIPLAHEVDDKKIIKLGTLLGGSLITLILIFSHLSLVTFPSLHIEVIPTVAIMKLVAPFLYVLYLFIIFGEIFSTIIGNSYGMERQISKWVTISSKNIYILFFTVSFFIAQFEYAELLTLFYPLFGYLGILILLMLWIKVNKFKFPSR